MGKEEHSGQRTLLIPELPEFCVLGSWVQRMEPLVGRKRGRCAFPMSVG